MIALAPKTVEPIPTTFDFRLADGSRTTMRGDQRLPDGLAGNTEVVIIGERILPILGEPILAATTLDHLMETYNALKSGRNAAVIASGALSSIRKMIPRNNDVFGRYLAGDEAAAREWGDFMSDIVIIAAYMMSRGKSVDVIMGGPKLQTLSDGRVVGAGVMFHVDQNIRLGV